MKLRRRASVLAPLIWLGLIFVAYMAIGQTAGSSLAVVLQSLLLWGALLFVLGVLVRVLTGVRRKLPGGARGDDWLSDLTQPQFFGLVMPGGPRKMSLRPPPKRWTAAFLRELEWRRFEELCEGFWLARGYPVKATPAGPGGGANLIISERDDPEALFAVIQCKATSPRPVEREAVRALWALRQHVEAKLAVFYSASGFTDEAREFAHGRHLKLVDAGDLLAQLNMLDASARDALLAHVTRDDFRTPSCPQCRVKMQRRAGAAGGPEVWGCRNERRCGATPIVVGL